eukprot:CAMPEP_0181174628 /NCGR_PEP_ID=MMETSP1096-20121128/3645_1 /TAXON_ID=156174 ORGANISM="Chrysochromulina ericina, Strain CCMP281" /NCGR_SAMPLE_ID=MMETSP1096 /ASSEMBLY_ACC=CAM_ASM_000453 /LENGTH=58 /DNA_ID=CAMNT_0023262557 /DNA_START=121 /DNA_END=297 /DNA_ORIENTATION=-
MPGDAWALGSSLGPGGAAAACRVVLVAGAGGVPGAGGARWCRVVCAGWCPVQLCTQVH